MHIVKADCTASIWWRFQPGAFQMMKLAKPGSYCKREALCCTCGDTEERKTDTYLSVTETTQLKTVFSSRGVSHKSLDLLQNYYILMF